jgi:hypothetical protein
MKLGYKPNALLSVFGEKITYKDQSIKASVEIGEYDGKGSGFVDKALADKAQIWVRAKDVPEPRPKDEVYINGEKWYVDHVSNFDGTMYCLEVVHNVRAVRP